jgi:hypothetical protein
MECSTEGLVAGNAGSGEAEVLGEWEALVRRLPADLERSAVTTGALVRRRKVKTAQALLRMILLYAACDWSLRTLGAWGTLLGLGSLSDVALLKRLRKSCGWLGHILGQMLEAQTGAQTGALGQSGLSGGTGVRVRVQDASIVTAPGPKGSYWRLHVSLDLASKRILGVQLTDAKGGETLSRFPLQPGEIVIGDRGYNAVSSLTAVLPDSDFIVRMQWCGVPLVDAQGQRFNTVDWLKECFPTPYTAAHVSPPQAIELMLVTPAGRVRVRLIACALPEAAASRARRRARKRARKSGYTASQNGLFAVGFFFVLTSLPAQTWPPQQVLDFYRFRWQVELFFKRLKSILHFDHLRAFDPHLIQTYLLAKILLALLLDADLQAVRNQCPHWFADDQHPVSYGRLTTFLAAQIQAAIRGSVPRRRCFNRLPALHRYLCNSPRRRIDQAASAARIIQLLNNQLLC